MGQSATLYPIDKSGFSKIIDNPKNFGLFKISKRSEIFDKSFDGLQFVLSKGLDKKNKELIEQIFYPKIFVGEQLDFSKIDFENVPDDFDFEDHTISYNDPDKVLEIYQLLATITLNRFQSNFDHNELNKHEIYPGDVWNDKKEEKVAFNIRHMTIEFESLKSIFKTAKENDEYLLSYVG
ncbi:MAG: DUF1877 family protein [Flavobacterium sp.]|nr:DUF1877 family protein [Flavobacterium sp.]